MPAAEPLSATAQPRALRVLVVEDEARMRTLLLDVLPDMGYAADAARSAEVALRLMERDPYDILILDLQLPLMSGMDFFQIVRQRWPRTQVIVLTGFGDFDSARRAIHLDVVEFLAKPSHLRDIEIALDRARRKLSTRVEPIKTRASEPAISPARKLEDTEREQILAAISRHQGNRTAAAAELGISRRTMHYRLSQYRQEGYDVP